MGNIKGKSEGVPTKTTKGKKPPLTTKTGAYGDIAQGRDPREPPTPGQPPRHTPGSVK